MQNINIKSEITAMRNNPMHINIKLIVIFLVMNCAFFASDFFKSILVNILYFLFFHLLRDLAIVLLALLLIITLIISSSIIGVPILIACGVFSCPEESTFEPWLRLFVYNANKQEEVIIISRQSWGEWVKNKFLGVSKDLFSAAMLRGMQTTFLNCGVAVLAMVKFADGSSAMFIGVFRTWFFYKVGG